MCDQSFSRNSLQMQGPTLPKCPAQRRNGGAGDNSISKPLQSVNLVLTLTNSFHCTTMTHLLHLISSMAPIVELSQAASWGYLPDRIMNRSAINHHADFVMTCLDVFGVDCGLLERGDASMCIQYPVAFPQSMTDKSF
eukprot:GHVN01058371.1.p1 GENE.GHVN01058371.1~~GHVN01058371.1.p1  ORF type:complete len:138 (+),score=9.78 GHVN01058371.1:203-616(+)